MSTVVENKLATKEWLFRQETQDSEVMQEVFLENCYSLPPKFGPNDVIIDVGAHIGCFAAACLDRGCGKVICIEPDNDNLDVLYANMAKSGNKVEIMPGAVWHDGRPMIGFRTQKDLTAMCRVDANGQDQVPVIALNDVLYGNMPIRLLKMDAEGAEWAFLYLDNTLYTCDEVVVELHLGLPVQGFNCTLPAIYRHMRRRGWDVLMIPGHNPKLNWLMHCWRI